MLTTPTGLKKRIPQGAHIIFKRRKGDKCTYEPRENIVRKKKSRKAPIKRNFILMETEYDFLFKYNVVKSYFAKREDISSEYLEMFFYLNHISLFTTQDYNDILFFGKKPSIKKLKKEGWVEKFSMEIKRPMPIYTLSRKAKYLVTHFHQMLLDEKNISCPETTSVVVKGMRGSNRNVILSKFKEIMG